MSSQNILNKEKSTIDVVRYYYDTGSSIVSEDSNLGAHFSNFISGKPN